jgi:alpha-1,6-mannosyltransferase
MTSSSTLDTPADRATLRLPTKAWHSSKGWQTNAALLLIGGGMIALARQLVSENDHFTIGHSGVSGYSVVLYLAAIVLILTSATDRFTFPIILSVAIVCRLVTIYDDPALSSDVYRYAWDGVVQHAHINPYRYVPGDKALSFLRAPNQDLFDNMNRRDYAHTIYPPAAQVIFYLITFINPTMTFMKTAMVLFEGLTLWALVMLLREMGVRREQTLIYAWCPLLIWEIGDSGHLDSVAMAFIALALLFRYRRQPLVTGLFLGLAVMTKMYPIVLLPALMMRSDSSKASLPMSHGRGFGHAVLGWDWKMPAVMFALIASGYAAYSSVGKLVFGFLGGYVEEEGMQSGARYFLLQLAQQLPGLHHLPAAFFLAFSVLIFAILTLWALRVAKDASTKNEFIVPAFALGFTLMLFFSPHYPWYVIWLVPLLALKPSLTVVTYLTGFFYLYTTELAEPGPKMFLANKYLYAMVLAAAIIELSMRKWPVHRQYAIQAEPVRGTL